LPQGLKTSDSIERNGLFHALASSKRRQYRAKRPFQGLGKLKTTTVSSETAFLMPWQAENDDSIERTGLFNLLGLAARP
jgi:hypothetical protein